MGHRWRFSGALFAVVLGVVLAVHLFTLYLPGSPEPSVALLPNVDKVIHVIAFAVPAGLLWWGLGRWWPLVLLAIHAPASEIIQHHFVPYRSGEVGDAVADLAGVGLGLLVAQRLRPRREPAAVTADG